MDRIEDREQDPMNETEAAFFIMVMVRPALGSIAEQFVAGTLCPEDKALVEARWTVRYTCNRCEKAHSLTCTTEEAGAVASYLMLGGSQEIQLIPARRGMN